MSLGRYGRIRGGASPQGRGPAPRATEEEAAPVSGWERRAPVRSRGSQEPELPEVPEDPSEVGFGIEPPEDEDLELRREPPRRAERARSRR